MRDSPFFCFCLVEEQFLNAEWMNIGAKCFFSARQPIYVERVCGDIERLSARIERMSATLSGCPAALSGCPATLCGCRANCTLQINNFLINSHLYIGSHILHYANFFNDDEYFLSTSGIDCKDS